MSDLNNIGKIAGSVGKNPELTSKKEDVSQYVAQNEADNSMNEIPSGASVIGRSMVSHDCTKSDIAFGIKNPAILEASDSFFDKTYEQLLALGVSDPYEKACTLTSAFAKEISQ